MKKPLIAVLAILLLAAIAAGWRFSRHSGNSDSLVLYGNVDIRQVSLAFEGAGRIRSLHAEEGDSVPAGALLAVLDTETLVLQAAEAQAQIDAQQQRLRSFAQRLAARGDCPGPQPGERLRGGCFSGKTGLQALAGYGRLNAGAQCQRAGTGSRQKPTDSS